MKRFLLGIGLGALIGFLVWAVVVLIGIWKGWTIPVIIGAGVGILTNIATWLVPKPKEIVGYLRAFWEACKMSPEERILYRKLAELHREQHQQPHSHTYLMEDEVDVALSTDQSENTVRVMFYLVSCLLDDTPIEACEIFLVYGGYKAPQGVPNHQIMNLLRLTRGNRHSYTIPVNDAKMMQYVNQVRNKENPNEFSVEVYLRIRGRMDKVNRT